MIRTNQALCPIIIASVFLIAPSLFAEAEPCRIQSAAVSQEKASTIECHIQYVGISQDKILTIVPDPADATVTYTITSSDALPASGCSGLTIDLTGQYQLECHAWKQDGYQSIPTTYTINWQSPIFQK